MDQNLLSELIREKVAKILVLRSISEIRFEKLLVGRLVRVLLVVQAQ